MLLVIVIDFIVVAGMCYVTLTKGFERVLPFFTFVAVLVPDESNIPLPGVFDLTTRRVALATLIALYFLFSKKNSDETGNDALPLKFLLIVHILWCLVATANSIDILRSFKNLMVIGFEYYVLYLVYYRSITKTETIEKIVTAMVYAMSFTTIFGAYEAYTGWHVMSWFPPRTYRFAVGMEDEARGIRAQSTFAHPILYGGALAMVLPLALSVVATSKSKLKRLFVWICIMSMFLCLYKTSSRGPWIASVLGFMLTFLITSNQIRKYMLFIVCLCVSVMVVRPGVYDTLKDSYVATFDPNSPMGTSYEYRSALRQVAVRALAKSTRRQLWGYGMESFYDLHLTGPFMDKDNHKFESCDSSWVEITIDTGYVGLLIFAAIMGGVALLTLRNVRRGPPPGRYLCWIFFANLIQYYFLMLSVAIYGWGQNGHMFWMTVALSMAYGRLALRQQKGAAGVPAAHKHFHPLLAQAKT